MRVALLFCGLFYIAVITCEDAIPVYNVNDGDKIVGRIQTKAHFVDSLMNGNDAVVKVPEDAKVTKDKASPKDEVWVRFTWTASSILYEWDLNFKLKNENVIFESATLKQNKTNIQIFKPMMNFGNWTHAYSCKFVTTAANSNLPEKLPRMIMQSNKIQVFNFMKNFSEDVTTCPADLSAPDVGHWNLTNDKSEICLRFDGAIRLNVTYEAMNHAMESVLLNVPSSAYIIPSESYCATADASVNETTEQRLTLGFYDDWSLSYAFTRDANITGDKRGDHWILHAVTLKRKMMNVLTPNCLNPEKVETDELKNVKLLYTMNDRSYGCISDQIVQVDKDVVAHLSHMRVQPFMLSPQFFAEEKCSADLMTSDLIPIIIGAALAILVVIVLVAYLIGRARTRRQTYENI
ncbi:Lysosome-associated membrane glycoprotein 1 [Trichinella pseudospiralis]|uniref:Lysosome-associated membrane glycoprotein 5 n=1 Tax=Trichinella pseudospiralis TaxID=6337 RepID=A0A0V1FVE3_TRIPS|nr:Lysosome-associated membrane glycoprotein 1 [Trichinella pseudospiralis]